MDPYTDETYYPQAHQERLRAGYALRSDHAKDAIRAIFAVMATGAYVGRDFIIQQFEQAGGYVNRLAVKRADQFILVNTDIEHWSRFIVRESEGGTTYGWHPRQIRQWNR